MLLRPVVSGPSLCYSRKGRFVPVSQFLLVNMENEAQFALMPTQVLFPAQLKVNYMRGTVLWGSVVVRPPHKLLFPAHERMDVCDVAVVLWGAAHPGGRIQRLF